MPGALAQIAATRHVCSLQEEPPRTASSLERTSVEIEVYLLCVATVVATVKSNNMPPPSVNDSFGRFFQTSASHGTSLTTQAPSLRSDG